MRTRKQIEQDKRDNEAAIKALQGKRRELNIEALLLCDDEQWFTEKEYLLPNPDGRKKDKIKKLLGKIHWKEDFIDEDTGQVVTIERSQTVKVNGVWE